MWPNITSISFHFKVVLFCIVIVISRSGGEVGIGSVLKDFILQLFAVKSNMGQQSVNLRNGRCTKRGVCIKSEVLAQKVREHFRA